MSPLLQRASAGDNVRRVPYFTEPLQVTMSNGPPTSQAKAYSLHRGDGLHSAFWQAEGLHRSKAYTFPSSSCMLVEPKPRPTVYFQGRPTNGPPTSEAKAYTTVRQAEGLQSTQRRRPTLQGLQSTLDIGLHFAGEGLHGQLPLLKRVVLHVEPRPTLF